jgi:hypothetical protein
MFRLSMMCNEDIKSRISYSRQLLPLPDAQLAEFIVADVISQTSTERTGLFAPICYRQSPARL